ncbi:hypothetical protein LIGMFLNB_10027 (plasmid) [Aeromonas hydrophila]
MGRLRLIRGSDQDHLEYKPHRTSVELTHDLTHSTSIAGTKKRAIARFNEGSEDMEKDPILITAYSLSEFYAAQQSPQLIQRSQADDLGEERAEHRH